MRAGRIKAAKPLAPILAAIALATGAASATPALITPSTTPGDALWQRFVSPPDAARPMVRWWWFGPAITDGEIDREIAAMKAGGFGGFEVQPTYPLSPDDPAKGIRNLPYLSDPFLAALRHAGDAARAQGMRMDLTLGSGWPFGGPHIPITEAAADVRRLEIVIPSGSDHILLPALGPGEYVLALYVAGRRLPLGKDARIEQVGADRKAQLFIAGRTGQQVKRAAVGAEGFVLDHASARAVQTHLDKVGKTLLSAFDGAPPPYAIFSDSLEAYGSSWTDDLPAEFSRRRGYDLLDHLPALFEDLPESPSVRFDWAHTLSELVDERYLKPITAWAKAHGTRFRAQVYGFPPPTLSSNALVDLPEGEGANWRHFTSTRWATSAAHLYGKPVVSSETWTWLHSPTWAATPLDMKVEADRHFLQGVNQLVGHGWPMSPPGVAEPGWSFYAASALNDHNPWYRAMPAVTLYLQRISAMMREGEPVADVGIYLPIEDAFADMRPAQASVNEEMGRRLDNGVIAGVLAAGETFDLIDAQAVAAGRPLPRVLILPPMTRIDLAAYRQIASVARAGGTVFAMDDLPLTAGGLRDAAESKAVARLTGELRKSGAIRVVPSAQLAAELAKRAPPAMQVEHAEPALGFAHRRLTKGDLYLVVNTGPTPIATHARFAGDDRHGQWWDPMTGDRSIAGSGAIEVALAPYASRLLVFGADLPAAAPAVANATRQWVDLAGGWTAEVESDHTPAPPPGISWSDDPKLHFYSGAVRYSRRFDLPSAPPAYVWLNFGNGKQMPAGTTPERPRAEIAAPVREAALVRVNGKAAGTVWAPPWQLDIAPLLKAGENKIEIVVMNGAVNALAGRPRSDFRLLTLRYGERFTNQDQDKIEANPSGLLGPISLMIAR